MRTNLPSSDLLTPEFARLLEQKCDRFEHLLQAGQRPALEQFLLQAPPPQAALLFAELLGVELDYRQRWGERPTREEYLSRFPEYAELIDTVLSGPQTSDARQPGRPEPEQAGRFQLLGEIARGGMGAVLRGRDPDLGRELAVKVVLPQYHDDPVVLARFLAEAQLAGQLQHPGLAPVYELGKMADGRPFFAMKLIQGRTLAELLDERPDPGHDLPRFLRYFEAICQAVGYAHSRGVIHRDLKPANVMVGEFGEVQVMDWGLAKVLAQPRASGSETRPDRSLTVAALTAPHTEVGAMIGTLAYIPPEQARGEIGEVDERSDVFGLGGILCEILTGMPPLGGQGDLSGAWTRLDGCGADSELVRLAKECLAPRRDERLANGAAVAQHVGAYLAGVQERLRKAELGQARAEARAESERKQRRLAVGLVAVVGLAVGLATAAGVYWRQQREWASERAETGLAQAAQMQKDYRFAEAFAMLDQVDGWVQQAADGELRQRLARAVADLELVRDLDEIRQKAATLAEDRWDRGHVRAEYPEVLARHELNVLEGDIDELAQRIRASAVRDSIVGALDDWASSENNRQSKQRLLELANLADEPDPWRQAVRRAVARGDERALLDLQGETKQGKPTPAVVLLLAIALGPKIDTATGLLREMRQQQPRDYWVLCTLGRCLYNKHPQEAVECFRAVVVLRPDSAVTQFNLGVTLNASGKGDEAITCWRKAIALDARFAPAHNDLGNALAARGKVEEAIACFRNAIVLDRRDAKPHYNLGIVLRNRGKTEEAIACYRTAIALDPLYAAAHSNLGLALMDRGKVEEAIACYRKSIALDPTIAPFHYNLGLALGARGKVEEAMACYHQAIALDPSFVNAHLTLALALDARGKLDEAIARYHKALALDPRNALVHNNLGNTLKAKGKVEEAIACFQKAIAFAPDNALIHCNLGVALAGKGKVDEAIACFNKAIALDPRCAPAHKQLGFALGNRGKVDEAIACFHRAIAFDPRDAEIHGALGYVLMTEQGQFSEARQALRRCLALLPAIHPQRALTSQLLQQCQQWMEIDTRLKAYLRGKAATPTDAALGVQMAELALAPFKRLCLTSARLYREALARQPQLAGTHCYNAACAAALAGTGQGIDVSGLDDTARAELRYSALSWLQGGLSGLTADPAGVQSARFEQVSKILMHCQQTPHLAAVRDPAALTKLPDAEQVAWLNLWARVDSLLERTRPGK
jgi:tetratricopeptide (TPR) repeat protein